VKFSLVPWDARSWLGSCWILSRSCGIHFYFHPVFGVMSSSNNDESLPFFSSDLKVHLSLLILISILMVCMWRRLVCKLRHRFRCNGERQYWWMQKRVANSVMISHRVIRISCIKWLQVTTDILFFHKQDGESKLPNQTTSDLALKWY
jgi:hypothetical protein